MFCGSSPKIPIAIGRNPFDIPLQPTTFYFWSFWECKWWMVHLLSVKWGIDQKHITFYLYSVKSLTMVTEITETTKGYILWPVLLTFSVFWVNKKGLFVFIQKFCVCGSLFSEQTQFPMIIAGVLCSSELLFCLHKFGLVSSKKPFWEIQNWNPIFWPPLLR